MDGQKFFLYRWPITIYIWPIPCWQNFSYSPIKGFLKCKQPFFKQYCLILFELQGVGQMLNSIMGLYNKNPRQGIGHIKMVLGQQYKSIWPSSYLENTTLVRKLIGRKVPVAPEAFLLTWIWASQIVYPLRLQIV